MQKKLRDKIFAASGGKCFYCQRQIYQVKHVLGKSTHPLTFTVDHVKPRAIGGEDSLKNCVAACFECNLRKGKSFLDVDKKYLKD